MFLGIKNVIKLIAEARNAKPMGLDKSNLIARWHYDTTRALEMAYRHLFTLSHNAWSDDRFIEWLIETPPILYAIY